MYKVKQILHIIELLVYIIQYFLDFAFALCKLIYYSVYIIKESFSL